jgi:heptosyltransferase-2
MTIRKILIKEVNWVGDTILTTPAIVALRTAFPNATITVLARPWVAPLLVANPSVDRLWEFDERESWRSYRRLIKLIKDERFDLGVAFPNSFSAAFLLFAGRVGERVGYRTDGRGLLLTRRVPVTDEILKVHQVEYYLNIVRSIAEVGAAKRELVLVLRDEERTEIRAFLEREGISAEKPLVILNPGAYYGSAKRWHPERFAAVADHIADRHGAALIVTGSSVDYVAAEAVRAAAKSVIHNLSGKLTLRQFCALTERASLFVTNDSGAMHVAAALGVPIVAIFGSTDWITTAPYSDRAVIVRKETECAPCLLRDCPTDHRCMESITVEDVVTAVDAQLERYGVRTP